MQSVYEIFGHHPIGDVVTESMERKSMRRFFVLLLVMGLLVAQAPAAFAQEAKPGDAVVGDAEVVQPVSGRTSVALLTPATAPVQTGQEAWIVLNWAATGGDAWDFRLTATGTNGVSVDYPENTVDHSSLMENDRLSNGELDYTALFVAVPASMIGQADLILNVTYQTAAGPGSQTILIDLPTVGVDGAGLEHTSDDLGTMDAGTTKWVDFWYTGVAPVVGDVQMTIVNAGDFGVTYPQEGPFSSLYYQSQLAGGESDVARVRLDADGVAPGRYTIEVRTQFVVGGETKVIDGKATIVVAEAINRDAGRIVLSENRDRSNPYLLDGATINAPRIYVFLDTPSSDIANVVFSLDGRRVKTEYAAPYDLYGTYSNGQTPPLRTNRIPGDHTITAEVRFSDGTTKTVSAAFTVGR